MLALTRFGQPALGELGASIKREIAVIYGVPFPVTKVSAGITYYENRNFNGSSFSSSPYSTVVISKRRVPKEAQTKIDATLGKFVKRALSKHPELAKDPAKLLKVVKEGIGLVGTSDVYRLNPVALQDFAHMIIGSVSKIGSYDVSGKEWLISVREVNSGRDYEFKLRKISSSSFPEQVLSVLAKPAEWGTKVLVETVDAVRDSLEAVLKLVADLIKSLCKIADSNIAKLAAGYAGAQGEVRNVAVAFSTGDKAELTKTVADVYAGGNATKIAAVGSALTKLQSFCGGPAPSSGGSAPKKTRWPLIAAGVVGGAAVLGGAGWLAFGGKRRRRR